MLPVKMYVECLPQKSKHHNKVTQPVSNTKNQTKYNVGMLNK